MIDPRLLAKFLNIFDLDPTKELEPLAELSLVNLWEGFRTGYQLAKEELCSTTEHAPITSTQS